MKLTIRQDSTADETEVTIKCRMLDERLQRLADYIRQYTFTMEGCIEGKVYPVPVEKIMYAESVDGRTFFYDASAAYEIKATLAQLEDRLEATPFVRISKSCILNTSYLKCVMPYFNHRMKAELKNGDQLIISRNYISCLREKLRK